ncbi:MAG: type II toxin-antitoxin system Phd/YefM family antitoxin [Candidatus Promineifilaceae bacterium]|nr:type II toxin-antitoxin system Phd/YefM family antitoxin [Candidatus Promineifilaceae bacterium]
MTVTVPITELKQRTGSVLSKAVIDRQDILIERYGQEYVVILSRERYQELLDAAQSRLRLQFKEAQQEVYQVTKDIPTEEIEEMVESAVAESRQARADADAGSS